tara:strand:- start:284 stop:679 length:396 start_codon:yes stop_codon:yes gene_type:complete
MIENLEILRNLIIKNFNVDPLDKNRARNIVDAKKVFTLIAFNEINGFSYTPVSRYMGYHHATLIHHLKTARDLLEYDLKFKEMYSKIESQFFYLNKSIIKQEIEAELILLDIRINKLKEMYRQNDEHSVAV